MVKVQKKVTWVIGSIVGFLIIVGLIIGILTLITRNGDTEGDAQNTPVVEVIAPPKTNAEAEALKVEATAAMGEQKFDLAIEKYTAAKAIYDAAEIEMYSSDLQMQIDTATQLKAQFDKNVTQPKQPPLTTTGG